MSNHSRVVKAIAATSLIVALLAVSCQAAPSQVQAPADEQTEVAASQNLRIDSGVATKATNSTTTTLTRTSTKATSKKKNKKTVQTSTSKPASSPAPTRPAQAPASSTAKAPATPVASTSPVTAAPSGAAPSVVEIGKTYPWFDVPVGHLADPYGYTGKTIYAGSRLQVLEIAPATALVVIDKYLAGIRVAYIVRGYDHVRIVEGVSLQMVRFFSCGDVVHSSDYYTYNLAGPGPDQRDATVRYEPVMDAGGSYTC